LRWPLSKRWLCASALAALVALAVPAYLFFSRVAEPQIPTPAYVSSRTQRMASRLRAKRAAEKEEPVLLEADSGQESWRMNRPESIPEITRALAGATTFKTQVNLRLRLCRELLWCGRVDEAIEASLELRRLVEKFRDRVPPESYGKLLAGVRDLQAISFFRMAEVENCTCSHDGESCLFPIRGGGVHTQQRGARAAIEALTESLAADPGDLGSRWLLNLAYMTVGEHPARVPAEWLLPESVFASERDLGRFRNVAVERRVDMFGLAGGCVLEDFDGDGHLDIIASAWSLDDQIRYYRNRGDGSFDDRTEQAGLLGQVGGLNLSHADFNNDGHADVLILRGAWLADRGTYPPSLLRGNGDGTFDDVTEEAGLLCYHPGQVGAWGDFDNDGWIDLFLAHEDDEKGTHPSFLFRNDGDGTFTECSSSCGLSNLGFVKGAAWGDYDNDHLPDLYVSRAGQKNLLFKNGGKAAGGGSFSWKFQDVTEEAGVGDPLFSFATWFFDYDNDGWLDIFVAGFKFCPVDDIAALYLGKPQSSELPRLYKNNRNGKFTDVTRAARLDRVILTMGSNFGDLDNDGFLDIYCGTGAPDLRALIPNRMFRNAGGAVFEDVTTSGGFGHLQKGHGIAFGDIDRDGDQDIYAVMGGWYSGDGFRNCLFENPGHGNHWITLRLAGRRTNRAAIGARIKLTLKDGSSLREVHATAGTGGSFGSSSLQQEMGLGSARTIEEIEVTWPVTGKRQVLRNVPADRVLDIVEE